MLPENIYSYKTAEELRGIRIRNPDEMLRCATELEDFLSLLRQSEPGSFIIYLARQFEDGIGIKSAKVAFRKYKKLFLLDTSLRHGKKYFRFIYDETQIANVNQFSKNMAMEGLRDIDDWFYPTTDNFNQQLFRHFHFLKKLETINTENKERINKEFGELESMGINEWDKENKKGKVFRNGIRLDFEVKETLIQYSIWIDWEVEYTLESFKALSDNKYSPPVKSGSD